MQGTIWIISRLSTSSPRASLPSCIKKYTTWTTRKITTNGRRVHWNAKGIGSMHKHEALLTSTSAYQQHHTPSSIGGHGLTNPDLTPGTPMPWIHHRARFVRG